MFSCEPPQVPFNLLMFCGTMGMFYPKQMQVIFTLKSVGALRYSFAGLIFSSINEGIQFRAYLFSPISVESNESCLTLYMFQCLHKYYLPIFLLSSSGVLYCPAFFFSFLFSLFFPFLFLFSLFLFPSNCHG